MHYILNKDEIANATVATLAGKRVGLTRITTITQLDDISHIHTSAKEAVRHAINFAEWFLGTERTLSNRMQAFMRRDFPYCFHKGIVLNRQYKPVGYSSIEKVDYADYPNLSLKADERFFFRDGSNPWRSRAHLKQYIEVLKQAEALL